MYGTKVAPDQFRPLRDLVGAVEETSRGNIVLRVYREKREGAALTYEQRAYVVLEPDEADELAREILGYEYLESEGAQPEARRLRR